MKNSILLVFEIISGLTLLLVNLACSNNGRHTSNTTDSLTNDSIITPEKDKTAIPLDSGSVASSIILDSAGRSFIMQAASGAMLEI